MPGGGPRRIIGGAPLTEGARLPERGPPFIGPFPFSMGPGPFGPGGPRGRGADESRGGGGGCCIF